MVPPCSDRITRVPPYSNGSSFYSYGAITRYGATFQMLRLVSDHGLVPFRSPLLRESRLISIPAGTQMFQFPAFAFYTYVFSAKYLSYKRMTEAGPAEAEPSTDIRSEVGFPIRTCPDQRVLAPPRTLSQRATSFIASDRQDIHQMPF